MFLRIRFVYLALMFLAFPAWAVTIESLAEPSVDSAGLLNNMPFTAWGDLDVAKPLLVEMAQNATPAMRTMLRRTLIQETAIQGKNTWLTVRLNALFNMRYFDDVLDLIDGLPAKDQASFTALKMDALFLKGYWEKACMLASANVIQGGYFEQAHISCLALMGDRDQAALAFDLWQEKNAGQTPWAMLIQGALMGNLPKEITPETPLDSFVAVQLNVPLSSMPPYLNKATRVDYPSFGNAVNVKKLIDGWQGIDPSEKARRLNAMFAYSSATYRNLKFIGLKSMSNWPAYETKGSLLKVYLIDKPETQVTGSDVIIALYFLHVGMDDLTGAMTLLSKMNMGNDLEQWVLEAIHP